MSKKIMIERDLFLRVIPLVNGWKHRGEAHLRGCPSTTFSDAVCSPDLAGQLQRCIEEGLPAFKSPVAAQRPDIPRQ